MNIELSNLKLRVSTSMLAVAFFTICFFVGAWLIEYDFFQSMQPAFYANLNFYLTFLLCLCFGCSWFVFSVWFTALFMINLNIPFETVPNEALFCVGVLVLFVTAFIIFLLPACCYSNSILLAFLSHFIWFVVLGYSKMLKRRRNITG